jgi:MerR HTH family regulatory protein
VGYAPVEGSAPLYFINFLQRKSVMRDFTVVTNSGEESDRYRRLGYISSKEVHEITGVTARKLQYWELRGVFGNHTTPGSGHRRMWHSDIIPIMKLLLEFSKGFGEWNTMSVDLLRQVVENYELGFVEFTDNINLQWKVE